MKKIPKISFLISLVFLVFFLNNSVLAYYFDGLLWVYRSIPCKVFEDTITLKDHFLNLVKNTEEVEYDREKILDYDSIILNKFCNKEAPDFKAYLGGLCIVCGKEPANFKAYFEKLGIVFDKELNVKFEKSCVPRLFVDIEYAKLFKSKEYISTETAAAYFKACLNRLGIISTELYVNWGAQRRVVNFYKYEMGGPWYVIDFGMANYIWKWSKIGTDPEIIEKCGNPEDYFNVPFEDYVKKSPISSAFLYPRSFYWESKRAYLDSQIFKIKNSI